MATFGRLDGAVQWGSRCPSRQRRCLKGNSHWPFLLPTAPFQPLRLPESGCGVTHGEPQGGTRILREVTPARREEGGADAGTETEPEGGGRPRASGSQWSFLAGTSSSSGDPSASPGPHRRGRGVLFLGAGLHCVWEPSHVSVISYPLRNKSLFCLNQPAWVPLSARTVTYRLLITSFYQPGAPTCSKPESRTWKEA